MKQTKQLGELWQIIQTEVNCQQRLSKRLKLQHSLSWRQIHLQHRCNQSILWLCSQWTQSPDWTISTGRFILSCSSIAEIVDMYYIWCNSLIVFNDFGLKCVDSNCIVLHAIADSTETRTYTCTILVMIQSKGIKCALSVIQTSPGQWRFVAGPLAWLLCSVS